MSPIKKITAFTCGLFISISLSAQDDGGYLKNHEGHVSYSYNSEIRTLDYALKVTPQEEVIIKQKLENFSNYLKTYNSLKSVTGFEVVLNGSIGLEEPFNDWCKILHSKLYVEVYPWFMYEGKPIWKCSECSAYFSIHFNRLDMILGGYTIGDVFDKDGIIMNTEPIVVGEQNGCKLYSNGIAVISNGKPLWLPVTVKEYNEALVKRSLQQKNNGELDEMFFNMFCEKIKEEESTLSAKELNSPAFEGDRMGGCPYRLEGARAIVKLNKDYFDKSKPNTAIQIIIVEAGCIKSMEDGELYHIDEYSAPHTIKMVEILKELNYSDFKRFLE